MSQAPKKDILFFSNLCDYSKEVISVITKKNIRNEYMFVCVDTNKYPLPRFVDRVPLIFTKNSDILYDESILRYIEMTSSSHMENIDVIPFCMGGGETFSFLDDNDGNTTFKSFTPLGLDQRIMAIPEAEDSGSRKSKIDPSVLDRYMQERDADISSIKSKMNSAIGDRI